MRSPPTADSATELPFLGKYDWLQQSQVIAPRTPTLAGPMPSMFRFDR
jgi:hypothetical protein